jgi:hypothetical protein
MYRAYVGETSDTTPRVLHHVHVMDYKIRQIRAIQDNYNDDNVQ